MAISGDSVPYRIDLGAGYFDAQPVAPLAFPSNPFEGTAPIEPIDEVSPLELANLPLRQLPEDGGADTQFLLRFARPVAGRQAPIYGTIKGKFSVKIPGVNGGPDTFQAAWSWKVRVWQKLNNSWFQIASSSVASDGNWSADFFFPPFPGIPIRVEYQPANRFFQIQDTNANIYTWYDETPSGPTLIDLGSRVADLTKTGSAPGIDKIYQPGMALWRKFKKYGMSALRDEPIQITYPNTMATGQCQTPDGNGGNKAWSCSQFGSGKIWLIQNHAVAGVVQHEIAHSIHSYYWDGNMPNGAGIPHKGNKCYNPGLALTEGFADFMPYWVQFTRDAVNPVESWIGWPLESLGASFCSGASNEAHVAATFWDAYDTNNETVVYLSDSWAFTHPYAPISTFLKNPGHTSMFEYSFVYKAILNPNMANAVDQLFQLNTMFLP